MSEAERTALAAVLARAQAIGLLGPVPIGEHVDHARAMAAAVGDPPAEFLDLGAGGGVPGLVLAFEWPAARGVLLDSRQRVCAFLEGALDELGLAYRVVVACGRAEDLARDPEYRGRFDVVTARSFGPPAVTAECGVGFLRPGGRLVVSEPPEPPEADRWPAEGLAQLGLVREAGGRFAVLRLGEPVRQRWPRRPGQPMKRPIW